MSDDEDGEINLIDQIEHAELLLKNLKSNIIAAGSNRAAVASSLFTDGALLSEHIEELSYYRARSEAVAVFDELISFLDNDGDESSTRDDVFWITFHDMLKNIERTTCRMFRETCLWGRLNNGWTIFHKICTLSPPAEVVQTLIDITPPETETETPFNSLACTPSSRDSKEYPLHIVAKHGGSLDLVRVLVDIDTARHAICMEGGTSAIHILIANKENHAPQVFSDILRHLILTISDFHDNQSVLLQSAPVSRLWNQLELLNVPIADILNNNDFIFLIKATCYHYLSLKGEAESKKDLLSLVDTLFTAADKDTMTVGDINRSVATHYGWAKVDKKNKIQIKKGLTYLMQGSVSVEKGLEGDEGEGAKKKGGSSYTQRAEAIENISLSQAFTICCLCFNSSDYERELKGLLLVDSKFLEEKNEKGEYPIHGMIKDTYFFKGEVNYNCHSLIEVILNAVPQCAKQTDGNGRLPLHIVSDPETLTVSPYNGRGRIDLVHTIWKAYPDAVGVADKMTGLPPFLLAARGPHEKLSLAKRLGRICHFNDDSLSSSFFLLKQYPEIIADYSVEGSEEKVTCPPTKRQRKIIVCQSNGGGMTGKSDIPESKKEPTNSQVLAVVDTLFAAANKETATLGEIVNGVAKHFGLENVDNWCKKIEKRCEDLIEDSRYYST